MARTTNSDQESLRKKALKLFGLDHYPILNLLMALNADDTAQAFSQEGEALYNFSKKKYGNALASRLCNFYSINQGTTSRRCCLNLLRCLLHLDGLWYTPTFSEMVRNEVKRYLKKWLDSEQDAGSLKILISLISEVGSYSLKNGDWHELREEMFASMISINNRKVRWGLRLYRKMIPKCPEVFSPLADVLRQQFEYCLTVSGSQDIRIRAAAVGAAFRLIEYSRTPENHQMYEIFFADGLVILFLLVEKEEHELSQGLLKDFLVLARKDIRFFRSHMDSLILMMVVFAESGEIVAYKTRQLAINFFILAAENHGSAMVKDWSQLVRRLLKVLVTMMDYIFDVPSWGEADTGHEDVGVTPLCFYAMVRVSRLANADSANAIGLSFLESLKTFWDDSNWQRRYAAVTALGLLARGCSKIMEINLGQFVDVVRNLIADKHHRVRWAAIHTVGLFSKVFSPNLQEKFHWQLVPALLASMGDFDNPRILTHAALVMALFSKNCSSSTLKPYLNKIVSKLLLFLQEGQQRLKVAALDALAALAYSSKEDFLEYYENVVTYMQVVLVTATEASNHLMISKSLECITKVGLAVGKQKFKSFALKVIEERMLLQKSYMEPDGRIQVCILRAWTNLFLGIGTDFLPFLRVAMLQLIQSAKPGNDPTSSENPDDIDAINDDRVEVITEHKMIGLETLELDQNIAACHLFSCLATELRGGLHAWINEVLCILVPLMNLKFREEVKFAAVSAMPLLLQCAVSATKKGLPLLGFSESPTESITGRIILALGDGLFKEPKVGMQDRILEALAKCIKVSVCQLNKNEFNALLLCLKEFIIDFSDKITERKKRVNQGLYSREHEMLSKEIWEENMICERIIHCLEAFIKTFKTFILPQHDQILSMMEVMWRADKTAEERTIALRVFRAVAEEYGEGAGSYYSSCLPDMLGACENENPDVRKVVALGIGVCAEFGGGAFRHYLAAGLLKLGGMIENPDEQLPENIIAYEAAISAFGSLCLFHSDCICRLEVFSFWLGHLPLETNLIEAKTVHGQLCSMMEKFPDKVTGPDGANIPKIISIFAEVLWTGENLATSETIDKIKKLLLLFQQEAPPDAFTDVWKKLSHRQQTILGSIFQKS